MGKDLLAFVVMVIVQLAFAGMIIITKLVMDGGMNPFVQSAYRPIFATISIAPFAFFLERYPFLLPTTLNFFFFYLIFFITYVEKKEEAGER